MTAAPHRVVVVGASLAGIRAVQGLRENGFDGELALVGAERSLPYERPPLSKRVLGGSVGAGEIQLVSREEIDAMDLDLRLGRRATGLDTGRRVVELDDGETISYDALVIATGCAPWMPASWAGLDGVHLLRTLDDCLSLRADLERSPRVAVVGAGFIGCEVASTARQLGLDVTLIDQLPAPMARVLPPALAEASAAMHLDAGVSLLHGVSVSALEGGTGGVERVRLGDGRKVDADVVVVGIGVRPEVDWLAGSPVAVADGVVCDERCSTSVPGVFAAGDLARWFNPRFGRSMRVEHWTNASEQGTFVARAILGAPGSDAFSSVPFVWSEQHGVKIEIAGAPGPDDVMRVVEGEIAERRFAAIYERGGEITGAVTFGSPLSMLRHRRALAQPETPRDESGTQRQPENAVHAQGGSRHGR